MIKLILLFVMLIAGVFFFFALLSAGLLLNFVGRLFGKGRKSPQDMVMLQHLTTLTPGEKALIADSLQKNDKTVGLLADQISLDSLIAKGIIVQSEGDMGVMYYQITDTAWRYLQYNR